MYVSISDKTEINELQIKDFQQVFSKLHPSISLICVCGNHDVGNTPDKNTIKKYLITLNINNKKMFSHECKITFLDIVNILDLIIFHFGVVEYFF